MKNLLSIALAMVLLTTGCAKKEMGCVPVSPQSEEAQIKAFATANNITATKHSTGIFYEIVDPGTGTTGPALTSNVYITYTGKFLDGTVFDQGNDPEKTGWKLGGLIEGWQIGLPLIKKGGKIKLIIPSSLAYGCNPVKKPYTDIVVIPGNSVLYFDVSLVDIR